MKRIKPRPVKNIFLITEFFRSFTRSQEFAGILLLACTVFSLVMSNSGLGQQYISFWHEEISVVLQNRTLSKSIEFLINDCLMAIFFLFVGIEIKRELVEGELSTFEKASLPVAAAIGGMIIPALIYFLFNINNEAKNGWAIPMATDIAFALGVLALVGKSVPPALRVFLTALAVIDDLGAILVIGIFYSAGLDFNFLMAAAGVFIVLLLLGKFKVNHSLVYLFFGIILWYCIYKSGVHATLAGVLFAFTIPMFKKNGRQGMLYRFQHLLHQPVTYIIMPIFALANTCIAFESNFMYGAPIAMITGIVLGLVIGKPLGILLVTKLAIKLNIGVLPDGVTFKQFIGVGFLAGIGFTMSIFIALLAFDNASMINVAKMAIVIASLISGILGYVWLKKSLPKTK